MGAAAASPTAETGAPLAAAGRRAVAAAAGEGSAVVAEAVPKGAGVEERRDGGEPPAAPVDPVAAAPEPGAAVDLGASVPRTAPDAAEPTGAEGEAVETSPGLTPEAPGADALEPAVADAPLGEAVDSVPSPVDDRDLGQGPTVGPASGTAVGGTRWARLSLPELAQLLQAEAGELESALAAFGSLLGASTEAPAGASVPAASLGALAAAIRWSRQGEGAAEIRRRLALLVGSPAAGSTEAAAAQEAGPALTEQPPDAERWQVLLARVGQLHATLERSEERWAEDRDRLLTTLMRTHQELQSLRVEVSPRSRRNRRRGLWARLWG